FFEFFFHQHIFDLAGSPEELSLFTDVVKRWDITDAHSLPCYMQSCYLAPFSVTNEMAKMVEKEHSQNPIHHFRKAWEKLFDAFMLEAKWFAGHEDEGQYGLDGSYKDYYMSENPSSYPDSINQHIRSLISKAWEELNKECFSIKSFPPIFQEVSLNFARMVRVMYSYDEKQKLSILEEYANFLLL
ncbi:hypothetical protein EJB05_47230, partial [Eragrostis curvula]